MVETLLRVGRRMIPAPLFRFFQPAYHFGLGFLGALWYGFPSQALTAIGVTGTKGKSSTSEFLSAILESAGYKTALLSTIRFKIGETSSRNLLKMTMPGRFLIQKLLREAVRAGCTHAVIEMTSEGAKQFRERFISMNALIFTNLSPEHIESHGSLEKYIEAKLRIGRTLVRSSKRPRVVVANADDPVGKTFLALPVDRAIPFRINDAKGLSSKEHGSTFDLWGMTIRLLLPGVFNVANALAAACCARELGISTEHIRVGLQSVHTIPGRVEDIALGQPFRVIVDYAHTPESLKAIYGAIPAPRICVLGNTGGGRDTWKRPVMGGIADEECAHIILTDEDPYDEDPNAILAMMKEGMRHRAPEVILDRKAAIRRACEIAKSMPGSSVVITGKGTDPFIMGPRGTKAPWDDRRVAEDVLCDIGYEKNT